MNKAPLGCLILHGLSSHINCVDGVVPRLEKYKIPYRMPVLRGHMGKPDDLFGVKWQDWYSDAEKAFKELLSEVDRVVIIALSMGSMPGLDLAVAYQDSVAGVVAISPALKLNSPIEPLIPLIGRIQKKVVFKYNPQGQCDEEMVKTNQNYTWIPGESVMELKKYYDRIRRPQIVGQLKMPLLVLAAQRDLTADPRAMRWLYDTVASSDKQIKWFYRSGHEMLRDCEKEQAFDEIEAFVVRLNDEAHHTLSRKQVI